jgi:hypothetical protein
LEIKMKKHSARLVLAIGISLLSAHAMAAGALAIDSNQGTSFGWAEGQSSISQAEQRALNECGGGCRVVLTYGSGCGAYAADQAGGSTANGWGTATSGGAAQSRAVSECQSHGGRSCVVRAWSCN